MSENQEAILDLDVLEGERREAVKKLERLRMQSFEVKALELKIQSIDDERKLRMRKITEAAIRIDNKNSIREKAKQIHSELFALFEPKGVTEEELFAEMLKQNFDAREAPHVKREKKVGKMFYGLDWAGCVCTQGYTAEEINAELALMEQEKMPQ